MKQMLQIRCKNNKKTKIIETGSLLSDVYNDFGLQMEYGPMSASVNNKIVGLDYRLYHNTDVKFIDITTASGSRAYTRTLFFILCKALHDLWPEAKVVIDIPVSNGYYCDIRIGRPVTDTDADSVRARMQEIIDADIPICRHESLTDEAVAMFKSLGMESKAKLLKTQGKLYTVYYDIDGYSDYYYGTLLPRTGMIYLFGIEKYYDGLLLRTPLRSDPSQLGPLIKQDKMFEIFQEHHRWQDIIGVRTVGDFNEVVAQGYATGLINISEALQEKKIAHIAEMIAGRKDVRMILISGPSSSGKTTFCKRLSVQLFACGIKPVAISLDDYFVDRDKTPRDEKGEYDYESLYALDLPLLNRHLNALFRGEEVALPRYDFQTGKSIKEASKLKLEADNLLVLEGIHALNPELTADIPDKLKFKIYASALTTILLDSHNYIPTTDNRLLRRIIRDHKYRGVSALDTIRRWHSVRAGENKWIFPYQENADVMFNTALLFELAAIKTQATPLLEQVPENVDEHAEAYRLLKFLKYIYPIPDQQLPPTSLLREFLGGSSFKY
ncbi:MAG: nucleoside kinase [Prevotella sp.]